MPTEGVLRAVAEHVAGSESGVAIDNDGPAFLILHILDRMHRQTSGPPTRLAAPNASPGPNTTPTLTSDGSMNPFSTMLGIVVALELCTDAGNRGCREAAVSNGSERRQ